MRRGAGAVERGGLENRCTCNAYRGFESHPLRHRRSGSSGPGAPPSGAWWFRSHGVQVQPDSGAHGGRLGGYAPPRSDGRPGGRGMAACPPGGRKRPGRNPWRVRHRCGGAAPRQVGRDKAAGAFAGSRRDPVTGSAATGRDPVLPGADIGPPRIKVHFRSPSTRIPMRYRIRFHGFGLRGCLISHPELRMRTSRPHLSGFPSSPLLHVPSAPASISGPMFRAGLHCRSRFRDTSRAVTHHP